jgi:hypothetical protein
MSRIIAALACGVVGVAALVNIAFADATPVQLVLVYMPNVSNTGTQSASGIAELVMPEGEVRITAADLPTLDGNKYYVAWVINTETNQFQRLGAFNSGQSTSAVHYENVLSNAIPDKKWNLLLVTVEDVADPAKPSNNHSIAGTFPRADNEPLPGVLPNTGGLVDGRSGVGGRGSVFWADWLANPGLTTLTLSLGLAAGYVVGKRRSRSTMILRPLTPDPRPPHD